MDTTGSITNPPEWADEQTMRVLFSPFRESRNVNPSAWDKKMTFWEKFIRQKFILERNVVFNARELPRKFERKSNVPFCLGAIVQNMIKKGEIVRKSDFQTNVGTSWASWSYNLLVKKPVGFTFNTLVKAPLLWGYRAVFRGADDLNSLTSTHTADCTKGLDNDQFVLISAVKHIGEAICRQVYSDVQNPNTDCIYSLADLQQKCQHCYQNGDSFRLALIWLIREKKCVLSKTDGKEVVVFAASQDQKRKEPVSDTEVRVFRLKEAQKKLHQQVASLQEEMEKCRQDAKAYLRKGMKVSAKNCLKRKHRLETQQENKESSIDNIHHLLTTIQQAHADKQVLDAYSSGVAAFKDITNKYGLTPDMVDDVMLGVQEVLEDQEELDRSMASNVSPDNVTMDELEQELTDLLTDDTQLPDVPSSGPPARLPNVPGSVLTPRLPQKQPISPAAQQDVIDSLCQLHLVEDDLPEVPSHLPGASPPSYSLTTCHQEPVGFPTQTSPTPVGFPVPMTTDPEEGQGSDFGALHFSPTGLPTSSPEKRPPIRRSPPEKPALFS